ncbi:MAG: EamA family transporter [Marinifilaceae bacterium]|jgi:drug/metabolite transporter (DMT)-like permease|nr:EamA family transporter [Marinifilaceae bacterium]
MRIQALNLKIVLALLALYIGWGSTYMAISVALEYFPPFMLAGIRFFVAGLIFLVYTLFQPVKIPKKKEIAKICLSGFLVLLLGSGSVIWVEQYLSTGLTSIVWASLPICMAIIDRKSWKIFQSNYKLAFGLLIGFVGVSVLFWDIELIKSLGNGSLLVFIVAIGGVLCFAMGSLYAKKLSNTTSTSLTVAIQLIFAGLASLSISLVLGEKYASTPINSVWVALLALAYLIIVGSIIAYFCYLWLLKILPASVVGTYTYVNPSVAILLGWFFLNEAISEQKLVALALIFIGVFVVNYYKSKNTNHYV